MTDREVAVAAASWQPNMAALYERRAGPRKVELEATLAPATKWNPVLADVNRAVVRDRFVRSTANPGPLPTSDEDIAYAPVTSLSRWIEQRELTSTRLTQIYLKRLQQFDPKLRCVITLTTDHAMARPNRRTLRSQRGNIAGRCTAFRGAAKTCSIRPVFQRPTAPSRIATACPKKTPPWSSDSTMPALCWSQSSVWARWR